MTRPALLGRARTPSAQTWAAVAGVLLTMSTIALLPLTLLSGQAGNGIAAFVIGIPAAAVGTVVTRRLPANPLGWLFVAIAACLILSSDGGCYALLAHRSHGQVPAGVVGLLLYELWAPGLLLLGLVVLLFPDGRLSSRWRWLLRVYVAVYVFAAVLLAVATVVALSQRPVLVDSSGGLAATDSQSGWFAAVWRPAVATLFALWLAFAVRQALSWRGSSGERRQQLKWLAVGAGVCLASAVAAVVGLGIAWLGFAALPLGIGVGILKYRLYEIDRIISRTLAYAVVTGLLVGVYAGLVLFAGEFHPFSGSVAVAAATLAAAALFNPLRRRVQKAVDRRFNRARYDADQTIAAFAARLQDAPHSDATSADLLTTVQTALEPAHAWVWLAGAR